MELKVLNAILEKKNMRIGDKEEPTQISESMPTSPHFNKILYKILLSFSTHVLINKWSDVSHFLRSTFAHFSRVLQNDNKQLSDKSLLCSQISQSTTETLFLGNHKIRGW